MRWVPLAITVLMVLASGEAFYRHDWRFGMFWLLDAAITGWSSYALRL
jgi:hypothetical protein